MTREEAILLLHDMKDTYDEIHENTNYETGYEQMTALDMAIEALEDIERWRTWSHTYDNLISKQDAIDEIKALYEWHDTVTEDRAVDHLKRLPSAEPKTGKWVLDPNGMDWDIPAWICSECGFVANYIGVEANGLGNSPMNWAGSKFCPQCGARITGYER